MIIYDEIWNAAKRALAIIFSNSVALEVSNNVIAKFEEINPLRKYLSDLESFIIESKLEDFYNENGETIFVSTIHKAKGKEFDNVFLLLEDFAIRDDKAKRQLYVGMTRAKSNLTIHLNQPYLNDIVVDGVERIQDKTNYGDPGILIVQLGLSDLFLDYFMNCQVEISQLSSSDALTLSEFGCTNIYGKPVLRFSKKFLEHSSKLKGNGYQLKKAQVHFIVHWTKVDTHNEIRIVLPEVEFERNRL